MPTKSATSLATRYSQHYFQKPKSASRYLLNIFFLPEAEIHSYIKNNVLQLKQIIQVFINYKEMV